MMRRFFLHLSMAFVFLGAATVCHARPGGTLGLGVVVGDPFGPTGEYWVNSNQSIDVGIGFDDDSMIYGDYLWHNWSLFPPMAEVAIAPYIGVGPRFEFVDNDDDTVGVRVPLGLRFALKRAPVDFYAELVPAFVLSPDTDGELDGGVGVRVYFNSQSAR